MDEELITLKPTPAYFREYSRGNLLQGEVKMMMQELQPAAGALTATLTHLSLGGHLTIPEVTLFELTAGTPLVWELRLVSA